MNIPDFQKLMHPFLEAIKDGRVYSTEQIVEMLRVHFSLTMDDMKVKVPNGNQSLFRNRIDWASISANSTNFKRGKLCLMRVRHYQKILVR